MKILVTGGTGKVGSEVIKALVKTQRERPRSGSETGGIDDDAGRNRGIPRRPARPGRGP
jgi:uncharacterized protein YbjT (DUF2867 family)